MSCAPWSYVIIIIIGERVTVAWYCDGAVCQFAPWAAGDDDRPTDGALQRSKSVAIFKISGTEEVEGVSRRPQPAAAPVPAVAPSGRRAGWGRGALCGPVCCRVWTFGKRQVDTRPAIAAELGLPLAAKDTIKEALMSTLAVPDVKTSRQLGRASIMVMFAVAAVAVGGAVWSPAG